MRHVSPQPATYSPTVDVDMANQHWAQEKERGSTWGIRTLLFLYRIGGKWLVKLGLCPVLLYFFLTAQGSRQCSLDYLHRVYAYFGPLKSLPNKPNWVTSFRHFWQFAQAALDKVDAWMGQIQLHDIAVGEMEQFEHCLQQGEGSVLIASHLGNVEVCRALVKKSYAKRMNVLVFTQHAVRFNRILKEVNNDVDVDLIQATNITPDLVIMLKSRVEQGESVVIVGDRIAVDAPQHVVWTEFLGKPAPFAIGPWVLASVLECPVFFISCVYAKGRYQIDVVPFADRLSLPRRQRQAELQRVVSAYAQHLENVVKEYPLQWYNFYNFWGLPTAK